MYVYEPTLSVWIIFLLFPIIAKLYPPVCSTLALFAIHQPTASGLQLGTAEQIGGYNFATFGKNKKLNPRCQTRYTTLNKN